MPDSQRNPKPSPQRKRPSKRCDCRWRVVLSENEHEEWEFRKSMNPNASEHNHEMMSPEEMVKAWPIEVNEMIIQLARQRLQTHEIREAVKQQFPEISWNERRFYNRLTEERKRIRQRGVVERSQRLLMLSARLCSVIASNEEWAHCVENDLQRMFENFCQLARLTPENINTLVDLQADMIQIDTDRLISNTHRLSIEDEFMASPAKKRRSFAKGNDTLVIQKQTSGNTDPTQKGIQMVHVPSYTIQVRSSLNRSLSESSHSSSRRMFNHPSEFENQPFASSSSFFSLASPTSSSSSSSSMPILRQQQQQQGGRPVSSPMNSPSEFIMSQTYQTPQPQNEDYTNTTGNQNYPFSPYTIPTSAFTSPPELPFAFEPSMMRNHEGESSNTTEDRRVFGFFPNVKEEPSHLEQQHMLQRQQQEYEQRMHRNFTQSSTGSAAAAAAAAAAAGNYVLPMIRSNQEPDESAPWT